jgi:hypothetical protein
MHIDVRGLRVARWSAAAVLAGVLFAACSSSSKPQSAPTAPKDTSSAQLTVAGDTAIAGALAEPIVNCSYPTLDGLRINTSGQSQDPTTTMAISVGPKTVAVRLSAGSGPTYHERDFTGTGLTGFDPAKGVHLDGKLREAAPPKGATPGSVAKITSISGDVTCGTQTVGKSTIKVSGKTGDGTLSGPLESVRVACFVAGDNNYVVVRGIGTMGSKRAEVYVDGQPAQFLVGVTAAGGTPRAFSSDPYATSLPTDTGLHVKGDGVESDGRGTTNKVHVEGDATCGNAPK